MAELMAPEKDDEEGEKVPSPRPLKWATNGKIYWLTTETVDRIDAGLYTTGVSDQTGPFLAQMLTHTDQLLELPDAKSSQVVSDIKHFWTLKEVFTRFGMLHKRGILLYGPAGCHVKGQKVLLSTGDTKAVEYISVGDELLGPDGKPRKVLALCRGKDTMVKVIPTKGEPFIVNMDHVLSIVPSGETTLRTAINMSVRDFMKQSSYFRKYMKLYRSEAIDFPEQVQMIPPYILGLWLGDGSSDSSSLTTGDGELATTWIKYGSSLGLECNMLGQDNNKSITYHLTNGFNGYAASNVFLGKLRSLNVLGNKHIPRCYLHTSIAQRRELLAGIIDTDGYVSGKCYDYISVSKELAENVVYLARSLGLAAYLTECRKAAVTGDKRIWGDYFRVSISGDLTEIPVKLERRKVTKRLQIKDVLHTGFSLEILPPDEYYGFILDKDHLYLLDDFTVTHNSGKTSTLQQLIKLIVKDHDGVAVYVDHPLVAASCLQSLRKVEPKRPVIALLEDIDILVARHGLAGYLALLDGEAQVDNVVYIGTTNHIREIDDRLANRPSRFDRRVLIDMPSAIARGAYIKHRIVTLAKEELSDEELDRWVRLTEDFSIAHLRELIVSVKCLEKPLEEVVQILREMSETPPEEIASNRNFGFKGETK